MHAAIKFIKYIILGSILNLVILLIVAVNVYGVEIISHNRYPSLGSLNMISSTIWNGYILIIYEYVADYNAGYLMHSNLKAVLIDPISGRIYKNITIDNQGRVGSYPSLLQLPDGRIAVSYYDLTNDNLKIAISNSNSDIDDWHVSTIDRKGDVGRWNSLAIIGGRLAVAYADDSETNLEEGVVKSRLKYAINSKYDGSGSWNYISLDEVGEIEAMDIKLVNLKDRPAIFYVDKDTKTLRVAVSRSIDGSSGWNIYTVDSEKGSGGGVSLTTRNNDKLVLSCFNYENKYLKFAEQIEELNKWKVNEIDIAGYICYNTYITHNKDSLIIAYHDRENQSVKLAISKNNNQVDREWQIISVFDDNEGIEAEIISQKEYIYLVFVDTTDWNLHIIKLKLS